MSIKVNFQIYTLQNKTIAKNISIISTTLTLS